MIDTGYLYGQLFNMGYDDVYRVSGADGDPRNFNDSFNIASTINGWQEFWKNWKTQLTDTGAMSNVAKFATVSDHYFRRSPEQRTNPNYTFDANYRWDSNDAEVTIPGAACPGVRVLIAAHGDLTPVSPTIVGEINNPTSSTSAVDGFNAARRHITLSNLSNGGAYDDTSGVAMTMAEYQALLRWYAANHTYPSKTFKVALIDADAGRAKDGTYMREGSEYYAKNLIPKGPQGQYAMFATMNANGASYPAYHFGTQYYWNNVATGGVGPWHTFITDTPSAPNALYPDSTGSIASNSTAISAFDADLKAAVTAGFAAQSTKYHGTVKQENPLRYNGTGSAPAGLSTANGGPQLPQTPTVPAYTAAEQAQYSPVHPAGTAPEAQILSTEDPAAAFWNAGIPGFSVGGVQDTNSVENPYPSTTSDAIKATPVIQHLGGTSLQIGNESSLTGGMTTSAAATDAGATAVKVAAVTNLVAGQPIMIDTGQNLEVGQIKSIDTASTTVTLQAALKFAHASGVPFRVNEGQPVGMTGDSVEHLNMWASGAPHGIDDESQPTEELIRALELPATYTSLLVSDNKYLGAVDAPKGAVAYFETSPVNPTSTRTVSFDAGFARNADGTTNGLTYYWDFGDGTHATGKTVSHTYAAAQWADVKLVVANGSDDSAWGVYRQALAVNSPSGSAPATPACGTFSAAERTALVAAAKAGFNGNTPNAAEGRN
ncbi:PKD domain-containing protein [Solirubrobacter soli]|uniref:PKD domain-containing protein n=1 Tax=Solirubrobacter soli TaxID=363832 RepID=UPI0003FC0067|nr:PKD domain-containing protein [Solirubrobacter soli]